MFGSDESRLLFMAKPPPGFLAEAVGSALCEELSALGPSAFPIENWHQSLSDRYACTEENIAHLRTAGKRIAAIQVPMVFNRIVSSSGGAGPIHRALRTRGEPDGFRDLIDAVQVALATVDMAKPANNTPHITTSYRAPPHLSTRMIRPFEWLLDTVLLVEGGGDPYRYEVLGHWKLQAPPQLLLGF